MKKILSKLFLFIIKVCDLKLVIIYSFLIYEKRLKND